MNCSAAGCDDLAEVRGLCWNDYQRAQRAKKRVEKTPPFPTRDDCPTCNSRRDSLGRLPIGLCGDSCLMSRKRRAA